MGEAGEAGLEAEADLELQPEIVSDVFLFHVGQIKRETTLSSGHSIWKDPASGEEKYHSTSFTSIHSSITPLPMIDSLPSHSTQST